MQVMVCVACWVKTKRENNKEKEYPPIKTSMCILYTTPQQKYLMVVCIITPEKGEKITVYKG